MGYDQWREFAAGATDAWITHHPLWMAECESPRSVVCGFAVLDGRGRAVAVVPAARTPGRPILVSGLLEPAGPVLADGLSDTARGDVWAFIDRQLTRRARAAGCTQVLLKNQILGHDGLRSGDTHVRTLRNLGYATVRRSFFCLDLTATVEDMWRAVSPRTRTQIRAAERTAVVAQPAAEADLDDLFDVYRRHSAGKGQTPALTPPALDALMTAGSPVVALPLVFRPDRTAAPEAFSVSVGLGRTACLFAWGATAPRTQLAKYAVWTSLMRLRSHGVHVVEYGGSIPSGAYAGLTEFYRRFGGAVRHGWWAVRNV